MNFSELTENEFKTFTNSNELKIFLQTVNISRASNGEIKYLGVKSKKKVIAAGLFIINYSYGHKKSYYCPKGPILDYNNQETLDYFFAELKKYIIKNNGYLLKIDPYICLHSRNINGEVTPEIDNSSLVNFFKKRGFIYKNSSIQNKWMFVLPLKNKTIEDIQNHFQGNVRNIIKKCEKYQLEVIELKEDLSRFIAIIDETAERKNLTKRSSDYYYNMQREFKDLVKFYIVSIDLNNFLKILTEELMLEKNKLINMKLQSKIQQCEENILNIQKNIDKANELLKEGNIQLDLAASMFCFYGNEVIYLFSGSIKKYEYFNAPYLMQSFIIKKCVELKYDRYNFYGIEDILKKPKELQNLYNFKKKFDGYVLEVIGELELYIGIYGKLISVYKKIRRMF